VKILLVTSLSALRALDRPSSKKLHLRLRSHGHWKDQIETGFRQRLEVQAAAAWP
jgi:hypothetical protein